jgi:hypothetical protein
MVMGGALDYVHWCLTRLEFRLVLQSSETNWLLALGNGRLSLQAYPPALARSAPAAMEGWTWREVGVWSGPNAFSSAAISVALRLSF